MNLSQPMYNIYSTLVTEFFFCFSLVSLHLFCLIELQIPSKPNYSLVLYYAAEKPLSKDSLLGRFVDGTDLFRDSRFKLIPSIVEVCID